MKVSRVDSIIAGIKNNPILSLLIIVGIIVIAIATFTGAVKNLIATIDELVGPPASVDISGKWKAKETEKTNLTYFDFKVVDDKLYGTVWLTPTFNMQHSETGIMDGQIIGNRVSFTTKQGYIRERGRFNFETGQRTPDVRAELIINYNGEIKGDEIHFRRQTGDGYYAEIIAKKIVDLTKISTTKAPSGKNNVYGHVYTLSGHEGGVQSLSFGPDQGRLRSGGLRLISGGSKDGKIKYWDVATAKPLGTRDLKATTNGGFVYLTYSPKTRNGGVDLIAVGVSKDGHNLTFHNLYIWPSGGTGGGGSTPGFTGAAELVAISKDTLIVAIAETETASKYTITIRYGGGGVKRTLHCEGVVSAMSLSIDGNLLASAEVMKSNETILKLWDTTTGVIKWRASSRTSINHLAFNPTANLLASAGVEDGQIGIWDASTGSLNLTLSEGQDTGISSMIFSSRGNLLVSAGFPSGIIKFWNASTGILNHAINNGQPVDALSFSYDDRLLAAGSSNKGIIKVWAKPKNEKITP